MWHLTACKILISLSFLKWFKKEMILYRVSELMLPCLIAAIAISQYNTRNDKRVYVQMQKKKKKKKRERKKERKTLNTWAMCHM